VVACDANNTQSHEAITAVEKEKEELEPAKECEALINRGFGDLAKHRRKEQEKIRLLRKVAELFKMEWPKPKGMQARSSR